MSEPWSEAPVTPQQTASAATPKSLLEQMQELLASLNASLAGLDADLHSSGARGTEPGATDSPTDSSARGR
nr:hypothetical protein [Kitasatospora atroaurantiaca]